jgi:hypothetical protein
VAAAQQGAVHPGRVGLVAQHLLQTTTQDGPVGVTDDTSGASLQYHHALPPLGPSTHVVLWPDSGTRPVVIAAV